MKTLFIKTTMTEKTPKGSVSGALLDKYKELYKNKYSDHEIKEMNLNEEKELQVSMNSNNLSEFFDNSDKYINLLKSIDKLIISVPMTNFSYTAQMKNFFDKVCVAGKTFKYKYDGNGTSEGLIKNLTVQIIATQGAFKGWYEFSNFIPAMEGTWKFLGAKVQPTILVDGLKTNDLINKSIQEIVKQNEEKLLKTI
ncbi:MAG: FMN-dependent NADH-azoreductase [Mycoplasma sp.]|nr:FMN-dependent NADH-azoreductase [Mycoplasma sp.]